MSIHRLQDQVLDSSTSGANLPAAVVSKWANIEQICMNNWRQRNLSVGRAHNITALDPSQAIWHSWIAMLCVKARQILACCCRR
jgi:hypothetical protein